MKPFSSRFDFGTKAETLERIVPLLTVANVPGLQYFTVGDWKARTGETLDSIATQFQGKKIIVRSSALAEDAGLAAKAGAFLSIPKVDSSDREEVKQAVSAVILSYAKFDGADPCSENQVLVQEMIENVSMSGVIFTQEMNTGAPYYVVNYDDESGSTASVTSGEYNNRTIYVLRSCVDKVTSTRFTKVFRAVKEIEKLVDDSSIDIEFALTANYEFQLLQVRRITTKPNWNRGITNRVVDKVHRVCELLQKRYQLTETRETKKLDVVLGNMPDWNPAEMIGAAPRPLSSSLYRHLITDSSWRFARRQMNYHHRPGRPLMLLIAGQPYIDVLESFYSFLPSGLTVEIQDKLVGAWLNTLRENHHLHDKVEFDVALTAYTLDFSEQVERLIPGVLSEKELVLYGEKLRRQAEQFINFELASVIEQFQKVDLLNARRKEMLEHSSPNLDLVAALLEDAIEYGTIPFSILARHGFVARSILQSLVAKGILSLEEMEQFRQAIPTVASDYLIDLQEVTSGSISKADFMENYGHLRPGTYDILSLRYDQRDAGSESFGAGKGISRETREFILTDDLRARVTKALKHAGLNCSVKQLFDYIEKSTQGREYAKLQFTKNLSDSLEVLALWGEKIGLSRDELSYINITDIFDSRLTSNGRFLEESLRELSQKNADEYTINSAVKLPFLITSINDLYVVPLAVHEANYITKKDVTADVVVISGADFDPSALDNKIVAIESADPGFDWIFSRSIVGLVTKFGGANSHMAIRCAEFNLPAAIGCGEQIFHRVIKSRSILLMCSQHQIKFIQGA